MKQMKNRIDQPTPTAAAAINIDRAQRKNRPNLTGGDRLIKG